MHYTLAVVPALAILAQAVPQAIKIAAQGPARITDIDAEAARVMRIMSQQAPAQSQTKPVTVTGAPATVTATKTAKVATTKKTTTTTKKKSSTKKTTARKTTTKKKQQHKRAAATTSSVAAANVKAASGTTTTASTTSAAPIDVNTACATQPVYQSYYPAGNATDPQVFLKDRTINNNAANAVTPSGYNWMWSNYMMQTSTRGFLNIYNLATYNVSQCAAYCDSTSYCYGFNIFYERDPSLAPAVACPNPSPIASIRCTLWDSRPDIYSAINYGQWRSGFAVVVAGSNGYARS